MVPGAEMLGEMLERGVEWEDMLSRGAEGRGGEGRGGEDRRGEERRGEERRCW
jgi:hypothetical protein